MLGCLKKPRKNNNQDYAVIGLPMTLVVIIIVSSIIFSLYTVGVDYLLIFHQEQQVNDCVSTVCERLFIMQSHAYEDCTVTLNLDFPSFVDTIIFGYDSLAIENDPNNISFFRRSFVTVLYKNGYQNTIHCPFAFCDHEFHPLIFHSGSNQVTFSMTTYEEEVLVFGFMQ